MLSNSLKRGVAKVATPTAARSLSAVAPQVEDEPKAAGGGASLPYVVPLREVNFGKCRPRDRLKRH